tara:strand:+ start:2593 stop:2868 length:276 start_codon:yes stop_codon:yes gene_type:complete
LQKIKNLIEGYLKNDDFLLAQEENKIKKALENTIQKNLSKKIQFIRYSKGVLYLKTSGPTWRQEISFQTNRIIKQINRALKKQTIKKIQLR